MADRDPASRNIHRPHANYNSMRIICSLALPYLIEAEAQHSTPTLPYA